MKLAAKAAPVLVSVFLLITAIFSPLQPYPLFVFPAAGAVVLSILGKGYRIAMAVTVGLMVKVRFAVAPPLGGWAYGLCDRRRSSLGFRSR